LKTNKSNKPIYACKFDSNTLAECKYNIEGLDGDDGFETLMKSKNIIGLFDNQILRAIRDITGQDINRDELDKLIDQKTKARADRNNKEVLRIEKKINRMMFMSEYIVVKMNKLKHYKHMYHNGFKVNDVLYKRLSCSASQARVSTVVFCDSKIIDKVKCRLNNGRNEDMAFSPSKFNAYFGLYGSATKLVTEPKFVVVKDFENTTSFKANYVIEKAPSVDDKVIEKEMLDMTMNRTDGMGLISPAMAKQWAEDLELDYTPSQFCIRQSFLKGMLCVFDIYKFCEEINGRDYIIDTIYKNEDGEYIKADLRECDVIVTESQFKLWDSYDSLESYIQNCHINNLKWGVSLYTPKEANPMVRLNYQFLQTLDLSQGDIEKLAAPFVDWISGASYDNPYYMYLFLLGINNTVEKIQHFLQGGNKYWLKALLLNPELKNDKFIRTKIRDLIKNRIQDGCKGDIYVDGNFQVIVSDPYGFMQHVCGLEVTGLLNKNEYYSNHWNKRGVDKVDAMRSPLTYMSEHVILNLRNDDLVNKWYKHCQLGIILNYHGHETVNFAGSDFDMDILATVSSKEMIDGVYKNELPVVYDAPKPAKKIFTEDDLYESDTFSFGTLIGQITNKSSNGYALLPTIEKQYGQTSEEYRILKSRLQQCCVAQSKQIDKTKIGQDVKGIPDVWVSYNKPSENGKLTDDEKMHNAILLDKHPYFFRYVYNDTRKKYKTYLENIEASCKQDFKMSFTELKKRKDEKPEYLDFVNRFNRYCPVIDSDSPMNLLCKYIEDIDFKISEKIKSDDIDVYGLYKNHDVEYEDIKDDVINTYQDFLRQNKVDIYTRQYADSINFANEDIGVIKLDINQEYNLLYDLMVEKYQDVDAIVNSLIDYTRERKRFDMTFIWGAFGYTICNNVKVNSNTDKVLFPLPIECGEMCDLEYLGRKYKLKEVDYEI